MDMSIAMIGQAFNSLSYYRRRNALMAIMGDKNKVKNRMSENTDIIQKNTSKLLFGKKIDKEITEQVKLKKKSREFFSITDNKQPNNSINNGKDSFQEASSPKRIEVGGEPTFLAIIKATTDRAAELVRQV